MTLNIAMPKVNFKLTENHKNTLMGFLFALSICVLYAAINYAFATGSGQGNTDGSQILTHISGWAQGNYGKAISIGFVLIGIIMGMARQSLMAFAIGLGAALGLVYTPDLIDSVFTATLSVI